jgi:hypothetical protein
MLARIAVGEGTAAYNWIYIVIGVGGIIGGIVAVNRWLSARAIREDKLDKLLTEVAVNGGDSLSVGDTVARVEAKVDALIVTVAVQKGHTDATEDEMFRRLGTLESRKQVMERVAEHERAANGGGGVSASRHSSPR